MRIGVLFSSGKDSTFTLHHYLQEGWDVRCLLTLLPENEDSFMFQTPLRALVEAQAEALGLPILFEETRGEKEAELAELAALLRRAKEEFDLEGVAAGALASEYQLTRVERVCAEAGLKAHAPFWHREPLALLKEMVATGFDIRMTRVAAMGLDGSWLGKRIGEEDIERLAELQRSLGVHPGGEGGEFETIVLDGPIFRRRIAIEYEKRMESEERGQLLITRVELKEKRESPSQ